MRAKKPAREGVRGMLEDVSEHLDHLRHYYFDVVAVERDEMTVTLRRKAAQQPAGFRPRPRR